MRSGESDTRQLRGSRGCHPLDPAWPWPTRPGGWVSRHTQTGCSSENKHALLVPIQSLQKASEGGCMVLRPRGPESGCGLADAARPSVSGQLPSHSPLSTARAVASLSLHEGGQSFLRVWGSLPRHCPSPDASARPGPFEPQRPPGRLRLWLTREHGLLLLRLPGSQPLGPVQAHTEPGPVPATRCDWLP